MAGLGDPAGCGSGRGHAKDEPDPARVGEERSEPDPTRPVRKPRSHRRYILNYFKRNAFPSYQTLFWRRTEILDMVEAILTLYGRGKNNNTFIILIVHAVLIYRQLRMSGKHLRLICAKLRTRMKNRYTKWPRKAGRDFHKKLLMLGLIVYLLAYKQ